MWPAGQKTKQMHFWLADEDVSAFSDALMLNVPDLAWQCSHTGQNPAMHIYEKLTDALDCGEENPVSRQAFAPISPSALQFHVCRAQKLQNPKDGYAPDYVFRDEIDIIRCGRMAIRWDNASACEEVLGALDLRLRDIWKTMQSCTLPAKVQTLAGRPLTGFRIGRTMLRRVKDEGLYL